jgi:hypothetical protein
LHMGESAFPNQKTGNVAARIYWLAFGRATNISLRSIACI